MQSDQVQTEAAVLDAIGVPFRLGTLTLDALRPDELLVRIHGVGLCHTDLVVREGAIPYPMPCVLGHEGAGIVVRTGAAVEHVAPGDAVVLSFRSCGTCGSCEAGEPAYCEQFGFLNFAGVRPDGSGTISDANGAVGGSFFGQSSFAGLAIASVRNAVKVDPDLPLALLGPLGCGVQTGAGAVMRSLACPVGSSLLVIGGGSVGLSAVLGARLQGCGTIAVAEPHAARRALALELGATHAIDPAEGPLSEAAAAILPKGFAFALDTTALPALIEAAFAALAPRGTLGLLGSPRNPREGFDLNMAGMVGGGRRVIGILEGDSDPMTFIPELIAHYRAGRFPFDRLITIYPLEDINQALADQHAGRCVKPVLIPGGADQAGNG